MNKNYELAKLQVEDIKQMFLEGRNVSTIGREIGVYPYNVAKILEELGLYKKLTKQERQDIISNYSETIIKWYTEGKSLRIIVDLLKSRGISTTQKTIKKILVGNGITIKQAGDYTKMYTSRDDSFSEYTPESCYWAGLLAADGCIYRHNKMKKITYTTLSLKDKDTVENFKEFIKYTGVVQERETIGAKAYLVHVNNINICNDLKNNFNITPKKSLTFSPSEEIPEDLKKYFILRYLDGDGSITYTTTSTGRKQFLLSFVGTKDTLEYIKRYFQCEHLKLIHPHGKENNCYCLNIQGNLQLERLLDDLYSNSLINNLSMQRKYKKYLQLKQQNKDTYI